MDRLSNKKIINITNSLVLEDILDKLTCTVVEHYRLPTHCVGAISAAVERGGGRKPVAGSHRRDEECKDDGITGDRSARSLGESREKLGA